MQQENKTAYHAINGMQQIVHQVLAQLASFMCCTQLHCTAHGSAMHAGNGRRVTFRALEACWSSSNDLTHAMSLSLHQAICQVDHDCCSSHAMHQFDVLKSRLGLVVSVPVSSKEAGSSSEEISI